VKSRVPGLVSLVGAGPGDPELITVKGLKRLEGAEVVVHDRLVSAQLLDRAKSSARRIDVGKAPGVRRWPQSRINTLLVAEARRGRRVVRLKGGDPFVFGRGGEECEALVAAGIPFEIVPGVTSAIAAPACAGIPVTHRGLASAFAVVAGHTSAPLEQLDWAALVRVGTLVILMGRARLPEIVALLLRHGMSEATPAAVISHASTGLQQAARGSLADIAARARELGSPATVVVGEVVDLSERLAWFTPGEAAGPTAREGVVA